MLKAYRYSLTPDSSVGRWTLDARFWTLSSRIWILDSGLCKLDSGGWTLDSGLWRLDCGCSKLSKALETMELTITSFLNSLLMKIFSYRRYENSSTVNPYQAKNI